MFYDDKTEVYQKRSATTGIMTVSTTTIYIIGDLSRNKPDDRVNEQTGRSVFLGCFSIFPVYKKGK